MLLQHILRTCEDKQKVRYTSLNHIWFANHSVLDLAEYHYNHGGTHLLGDEVRRIWLLNDHPVCNVIERCIRHLSPQPTLPRIFSHPGEEHWINAMCWLMAIRCLPLKWCVIFFNVIFCSWRKSEFLNKKKCSWWIFFWINRWDC